VRAPGSGSTLRVARHRHIWMVLAVLIACVAHPSPITAQQLARSVSLAVDNDYFDLWRPPRLRPDDNYTQGARMAWDFSGTPRFAKALACTWHPVCGATLEVGQELYTPNTDAPFPVPGDRPYAGWLYGRVDIRGARSHVTRSLGITAGVTGPLSLGESAQNSFHRLFPAFRRPLGWANQLPTEVAFAIRGAQSWRIVPSGSAGHVVDLVPTMSASVGTLRTAVGVGVRVRVGTRLAHPWLTSELSNIAPYGFIGTRAEAVARDLFLDGTVFHNSVRVEHEVMGAEWERGLGVRVRRLCLEYRAVTRSREYQSGPRSHTYGSLAVSWTLR
jgi:lipid A 3-O-deacylase